MVKYIISTFLFGLIILEYQFDVLIIDAITMHIYQNIEIYIALFVCTLIIKLFWQNKDRLTSNQIQTELVRIASTSSLRETQQVMQLIVETDYKNDKQVHKLRDNIIMICLERMLLFDLVVSDRKKKNKFEEIRKLSIEHIQSYKAAK